jgi:hypothetical protein
MNVRRTDVIILNAVQENGSQARIDRRGHLEMLKYRAEEELLTDRRLVK